MGKKAKLGKFRKDKFYKLAKETGFRSRAAFKLIQLNRKFGFLQQSQVCIDLCAAPGGWMQVSKQNMPVSSIVIGVDLYPIRPIAGCIGLVEDITTEKCKKSLTNELKTWKADVVLHDGAPNVGKNWLYDAYQQICLTLNALKLATNFLKGGGWFVTKVFRSKDYNALLWVLKQLFKKVHATKPSASRKESAEIFVVCQGYFSPDKIDPRLLDAKYVFEELDLEGNKKASMLHPDKQKRIKAEGYTEKDILLRNELSVTEFMQGSSGLAALQGVSCIKIDDEAVRKHPRTTNEILECCKDLKVLGRKDVKGLLNWWKHVKDDLFKKPEPVPEPLVEEALPQKGLTAEEVEEIELDELDRQVAELADEEQRDLKRKRKKVQKQRTKLNEKMNLKMVIKGDEGPREQEDDIFNLKDVTTHEDLEALQDAAPEVLVENEEVNGTFIPKYKRYEKDSQHLDDDGLVENGENDEDDEESDSESDYDKEGLGLSDEDSDAKSKGNKKKKKKAEEHPLIKPCDYRDKDTKRKQRVQLWFEKENLQNVDTEDDEDYDLDRLADEYKSKGVKILGEKTDDKANKDIAEPLGKRAKRKAKYAAEKESSTDGSSDSDEDYDADEKLQSENKMDSSNATKTKRVRLTEEELALGAMMVKSRKTKRDLIDGAWNRYAFNDDGLPQWFVQDEDQHMRKPVPVPKELAEEYESKVRELNVRPIKKVMEAKARKKKRALKRLAKAKKKAEQVLENADASAQEKIRQLKKLYKKAEDKKKEVSYVVSKKHLAGKRVRRPPGVKGRFKVVDPRMKKDKRAVSAKQKRAKGKGKK